jgi:hypothetical protein
MKKILLFTIVSMLALSGFLFINKKHNNCVMLYVNYGVLDSETKLTKCIDVSSETIALDFLKNANLEIEGTRKYGLAVVCRVNGLPNKSVESCESMPSEKAYWAIIIKEKKLIPFPKNEWGWGQVAVDQQLLSPGDSIGLVWTGPKGELKFP